ncbi:MAG TPA: SIMPL domain-containing protein, partial [Rectinema sp.]|nr:SIMPL domain-containing protein [Rectinema sp.]
NIYFDEDQQGRRTQHVTYFANCSYRVTSTDIDRLERVSRSAGDLIAQGVALDSASLEYMYTKLADLRNSLLERATEDAKKRAEAIASSSGAKIGAVKSARMGVFQITPRYSTMVDDYGINDTSSRLKDVTAVVGAEFRLK